MTSKIKRTALALLPIAMLCFQGCAPEAPEEAAMLLVEGKREAAARAVEGWRPSSPEEWQLLARIFAGLDGHEAEAVEAFRPAGETGDPGEVLLAARVAGGADRPGIAAQWLESGLQRHPGSDDLAIELAKMLGRLERNEEAAAVLEPGSARDPRKLNLIGYAWLQAGDEEKARTYFRRSVDAARSYGRDFAPPHHHLGLLHAMHGEVEEALREQRQAAAVNTEHLEAHYQAMAMAERLGRDDAAAEAREGFARLYRERLERAGAFDRVIEVDPSGPVDRAWSSEYRPVVEEREFLRSFPAGSTIEFACLAPAGDEARFEISYPDRGADPAAFDHRGADDEAAWHPHRVELPAGDGEVEVNFRVRSAGAIARLFGSDPPVEAAFSEPFILPAREGAARDRPNLLLISLDTLRADRLGAYGHERSTSPTIDRLAGEGVRFHRAEAPSNWTLPSHYSMFSGLSPSAHGISPSIYGFQGYMHPSRRTVLRGSEEEVMLAEVLAEAGYRTAAVTEGGWISGRFGFDQGFRMYRSSPVGSMPATLRATMAELEAGAGHGPWFLFVHTYATHQPYHGPDDLRTRWADAGHRGIAWPEARVPIGEYNRFHLEAFPPAPSDVRAFRDLYDGQTAWADSMVEEIVDWLNSHDLLSDTVVVVTSDHGEEIFERGRFAHGDTLFEEVTRVPLVMYAPGRLPSGVSVGGPVSLMDLPGTLLDLAGLGKEHGQGRSLRPLWERRDLRSDRAVFAHALGAGEEPIHAVWRDRWKYVVRETEAGEVERCFDLEADPLERRPGACDGKSLRALLEAHLEESARIREQLGPVIDELDEEMMDRLRSLGYVH